VAEGAAPGDAVLLVGAAAARALAADGTAQQLARAFLAGAGSALAGVALLALLAGGARFVRRVGAPRRPPGAGPAPLAPLTRAPGGPGAAGGAHRPPAWRPDPRRGDPPRQHGGSACSKGSRSSSCGATSSTWR
jgi:hypothetical protein